MPIYEFTCAPCRRIYRTRLGMQDPRPERCPRCGEALERLYSPPSLNTRNFSSPTAARYARMSETEERVRERELQKVYETIWLPPEARHNPWEEDA